MAPPLFKQEIRFWRPRGFEGLELQQGAAVTEPAPRQFHEAYEIGLVTTGAARITHRGETRTAGPGSLVFLEPGEVHSVTVPQRMKCDFCVFYVPESMLRNPVGIAARAGGRPAFRDRFVRDEALAHAFAAVHGAFQREESLLALQSRLTGLLLGIRERYMEGESARPRPSPTACLNGVRVAREMLRDRLAEDLSLDELASAAGLSRSHFLRVFRNALGMPPHAYHTAARVARARELLKLGRSIGEVALETGFVDQSHFTRHFHRLVGVTPAAYQRGASGARWTEQDAPPSTAQEKPARSLSIHAPWLKER